MKIGQVFRYSRPYEDAPATKDGLPNYFHHTKTQGSRKALLESGINPIQAIEAPDGSRCPAILISSSPHKIGSEDTPWQDSFDPDRGYVRYYGDNKAAGVDPATAPGNKALLAQFGRHSSPDEAQRLRACPVLIFKRVAVESRTKGNVAFQGYAVLERVELVTQFDRRKDASFTNFAFHFAVLSLAEEREVFNWDWISARRDPSKRSEDTLALAPTAWRLWVKHGSPAIERCRRRVVKLLTVTSSEQQPPARSVERRALEEIYSYYNGKKSKFEWLAATVTERLLTAGGRHYRSGWITPAVDGGADFVGRLDLGSGFSTAKLVVLGQAKCEKLNSPTGGNHIARTVARLRRGWLGVYVTTSYFSEAVQREVLEDRYPLLLVNGERVAREVLAAVHEGGFADVQAFLGDLESRPPAVSQRDPEEIFYD